MFSIGTISCRLTAAAVLSQPTVLIQGQLDFKIWPKEAPLQMRWLVAALCRGGAQSLGVALYFHHEVLRKHSHSVYSYSDSIIAVIFCKLCLRWHLYTFGFQVSLLPEVWYGANTCSCTWTGSELLSKESSLETLKTFFGGRQSG